MLEEGRKEGRRHADGGVDKVYIKRVTYLPTDLLHSTPVRSNYKILA